MLRPRLLRPFSCSGLLLPVLSPSSSTVNSATRQGAAAEIALVEIAAVLAQELQLCRGFHAFGQHFHAHALAHRDHRMADGHVVGAVRECRG